MQVLDSIGYIELVETWGSDEGIIKAARMSTAKGFLGWENDARLLRYLWTHRHHTPFEMAGATFEIQAPIFVVREWHRHRTQSYNEMSGRYIQLPNLYYIPSIKRLMEGVQSQKNKQGSEAGFSAAEAKFRQSIIEEATHNARVMYEQLLHLGVSRELARLVIPVNQYTRFRASANLRNWLHFLGLRLDSRAQFEIREYAKAAEQMLTEHFTRTMNLFREEREQG